MEIRKPVVIVGTGRCGSSIFHKLMSEHPHLAWLTKLCDRYPGKPQLNRMLLDAHDYPAIGPWLRNTIGPHECWFFWDHHCPGFSTPFRDLTIADLTEKMKARIRSALSSILTPRRHRLLLKITGWPRLSYLRGVFPDVKFIHVKRDGRAFANSMLNVVDWWGGWRGPENWRWGPLSAELQEEWDRHGRSFEALACIEWKILMDSMEEARKSEAEESFLEITYEDLCADTVEVVKKAVEFSELDWSPRFERYMRRYSLRNSNHKWKEDLTPDQQRIVLSVLGGHLARYGYA